MAIKILPPAFANDPDRLARFKREAQVLASLNHPNIGAIYGFEDSGSVHALILELVEGQTLADLLSGLPKGSPLPKKPVPASSRALPVDEALAIARQIADALEAAHEQGIIHRDLKPANIKVRDDGTIKVLDFGLAKLAEGSAKAGHYDGPANTQSPTITTPAMTAAGMILGTAAYMSPEQAKGKPADKRSDIWAFGCVVFEMLTGTRAFDGEDVSDTLANVLKSEPDWAALPAETPSPIRRLLRRTFEKDRKRRLSDIADARIEIDDARSSNAEESPLPVVVRPEKAKRTVLPWFVAAVSVVSLLVSLAVSRPWRIVASQTTSMRMDSLIGADATLVTDQGAAVVPSPDGSVLAFVAQQGADEPAHLYIRRLDQLRATVLTGTDGARNPFFSPDGQWIGFFASGELRKVSVHGGAPITLCDAPTGRGGSWGDDGMIAFTPVAAGRHTGLLRVSQSGGKPEPLTEPAADELTHKWPQVLPGSRAVMFTANHTPNDYENDDIVVQTIASKTRMIIHHGGYYARYVPSGHVVYVHGGTLYAMRFDLARLRPASEPVPLVTNIRVLGGNSAAQFATSDTGILTYLQGRADRGALAWTTLDGISTPFQIGESDWTNVTFSRDGSRLSYMLAAKDAWLYDINRGSPSHVESFDQTQLTGTGALLRPDGDAIVFAQVSQTNGAPKSSIFWKRTDGVGDRHPLFEASRLMSPLDWSPDGKVLLIRDVATVNPGSPIIVSSLAIDGDVRNGLTAGTPRPVLKGQGTINQARFSPDGRWLAITVVDISRERPAQIYVTSYPPADNRVPISTSNGLNPVWSPTSQQLYFGTGSSPNTDGQIMAVSYTTTENEFHPEKPRPLPIWYSGGHGGRLFDLHPDGKRFVLEPGTAGAEDTKNDKVIVVTNFFDEIRALAK